MQALKYEDVGQHDFEVHLMLLILELYWQEGNLTFIGHLLRPL